MVQIQFHEFLHEYGLLAHDSQLPPPLLLLTIYRLSQSVLWDSLAQSYLRIMDHINDVSSGPTNSPSTASSSF